MLTLLLIFVPFLAAPLVYLAGRKRDTRTEPGAILAATAELALSLIWALHPENAHLDALLPGGLRFTADGFRQVYCVLAAFMWFMTTLFGKQYFRHEREGIAGYWFFVLLTLGATEGLFLAADFLTAFCFFEILSLSSFPWVAQERGREALRAAKTYLTVAVVGGLLLLMGLFLLQDVAGTLSFAELPGALKHVSPGKKITAGVFILMGFGAKAGMFPLHIWLPKAHPVAPAPASALLSGMLTKVGVFGILQLTLQAMAGEKVFGLVLLVLAVITMTLGAVLAVFSENLKRTLACSSMSQIGFILTGLATVILAKASGEAHGAELALNGTMLHMVNHSLLKLLLFLSAGAVAMNIHRLRLKEIQGWGRNKPLLKIAFLIGLAGIGGVPGLNGYLSKTLLHEGLSHLARAGEGEAWLYHAAEILFLFSGGLTFAYMLRLFVCVFIRRNDDPAVQAGYDASGKALSPLSAAVIAGAAAMIPVMSIPGLAIRTGAWMTGGEVLHFEAFAVENLHGALISLGIGALVYLAWIRPFLDTGRVQVKHRFDLEEQLYRPLLFRWLPALLSGPARLLGENMILSRFPLSVPAGLAALLGENRILSRMGKAAVLTGTAAGRLMEESLDGLVLFLRRTVLREEKIHNRENLLHRRALRPTFRATVMAFTRVADNFSYAMMMLCIGIVLVLALIALGLLFME